MPYLQWILKKFILEVYRDCEDIEKKLEEDIKVFQRP
jgi:hypothetical protein